MTTKTPSNERGGIRQLEVEAKYRITFRYKKKDEIYDNLVLDNEEIKAKDRVKYLD